MTKIATAEELIDYVANIPDLVWTHNHFKVRTRLGNRGSLLCPLEAAISSETALLAGECGWQAHIGTQRVFGLPVSEGVKVMGAADGRPGKIRDILLEKLAGIVNNEEDNE